MTPTVSVIVPCYNAAASVAETIESALAQDVGLEIIAIDDGSTDATCEVLKGFGERISWRSGPNRGVSAARNSGLDLARGEWVQFLDSDDLLEPGALSARLAAAQASEGDVAISDWRDFSGDGRRRTFGGPKRVDWSLIERDAELAFATTAWAPPAAVLYSRRIVEAVGGFRNDLPVIQDARHLFDAAAAGARFVRADHLGAGYRVAELSLSRRSPGRFYNDVLTNAFQIESHWRAGAPLSKERIEALADIYDGAARGLLAAGDRRFLEAAGRRRALGRPSTRRIAAAALVAQIAGVGSARRLFALLP